MSRTPQCHEKHGFVNGGPDWILCQVARGAVSPEEATRKYDSILQYFVKEAKRRYAHELAESLRNTPFSVHETDGAFAAADFIDPEVSE